MTFNPDGSIHQLDIDRGEVRDPLETQYSAGGAAPLAVYAAGLVTYDRPNLGFGYEIFAPRTRLMVLSLLIHVDAPWAATGAAELSIGNYDVQDWFSPVDLIGKAGLLPCGWGFLQIGPDVPLLVTVDGSPTAGAASIYLVATPTIKPFSWVEASQSYTS